MLLRVSSQRQAAVVVEAIQQHLDLDGREILHLVDHSVPVAQRLTPPEAPDPQLIRAQQQRIVLRLEAGLQLAVTRHPLEEIVELTVEPVDELIQRRSARCAAGRLGEDPLQQLRLSCPKFGTTYYEIIM